MLRAYRYPLHPTKAQESVLESWLVACQQLYNGALQHRRDAWRKQCVQISLYDQHKELTGLRAADPEWKAIPAWVERSALKRLDSAMRAFFRRCERGEKSGFPRFRSSDRYTSFDLGSVVPSIEGDRVRLPKIGFVKFHKYREMRGELKHVSVSRTARGWSISFVCDLGNAPPKLPVRSVVGVDVGLEAFATLSTGERVENPRFFRKSEELLARRQQSLARKRRGSNSRRKAKWLVARAHEHVRNQRLDFTRKLAATLFDRFDLIAYEDLAISRMVHGTLGKSIHDAAWGKFLSALVSKAEEAGKHAIAVDPRGTSQRCSGCGTVVKKTLSEREHRCTCGLILHRDENAARNVLALGLSAGQLTEAECSKAVEAN